MIDQATADDVAAIARLEEVALGPDAWSESLVAQGVTGDLPTLHYLVARDDGTVTGYAVASLVGDVAELQRIAVDPAHRRTGIASRLLAAVVRVAADSGAERLLLEVREDNDEALGFYGSRGFAEIGRRPHYYRDGATAVVMELTSLGGVGEGAVGMMGP